MPDCHVGHAELFWWRKEKKTSCYQTLLVNYEINSYSSQQYTHTTCVYSHYPLTRLGLLLLPYIPHQRLCSSHPICQDTERALRDIVSHQHIQQILTGLCNYMHLRLNSPDHFFILSSDKCQLLSHDILVSQSHRNQYRTFLEEVWSSQVLYQFWSPSHCWI